MVKGHGEKLARFMKNMKMWMPMIQTMIQIMRYIIFVFVKRLHL